MRVRLQKRKGPILCEFHSTNIFCKKMCLCPMNEEKEREKSNSVSFSLFFLLLVAALLRKCEVKTYSPLCSSGLCTKCRFCQ